MDTTGLVASTAKPGLVKGQAVMLDVESMSDAELVSVVCLQGLANREGARVFLTLRRRQCHSSFEHNPLSADGAARLDDDVLSRYRSAPEFWRDYYSRIRGYSFRALPDPLQLLDQLEGKVKGLVRFRLSNRCELPVAVTLAGIEDAVAVPDESPLLSAMMDRLPVVADIRDRFSSRLEASTWAIRELFPMCAKDAVFSQNDTNDQKDPDIFSLDLAVAGRMFVFNLDFWEARAPDHFALIQRILGSLEPMSPMYGWGTSEAAMMVAMGPSGSFLICTGCPNLSFHRQVAPARWPLRNARKFNPAEVTMDHRHQVAFMVNEGDTLKWMGSVMGAGRWLEPERGHIPVNWGISPFINERYPGMMEYFYQTSSAEDVFVSSISGYGYYGMKHCLHAGELAEREACLLEDSHVSVGSVYAVHGMLDATNGNLDPLTEEWLVRRGCRGYIFEAAQRSRVWQTRAGQPVIGVDWSLFYWKYRLPGSGLEQLKAVADRIVKIAEENGSPSFIPVYGGSPADFIRIAAHLDPAKFKIVGIDEMVETARLAGVTEAPARVSSGDEPASRTFSGRTVMAAARGQGKEPEPVRIDLAAFGSGRMAAEIRFSWDASRLHIDVEEVVAPVRSCESRRQAGYAAGEFDLADGIGLWFDFDLDGTKERGDFTLWLGFSSRGCNDLWCCMLNDKVLAGVHPVVGVQTSSSQGLRRIQAAVAWADLQHWIEPEHLPASGLVPHIGPGFTFACQPMLLEGLGGRSFLNGKSNRRENATAAVLQDERESTRLPMPDGVDSCSLRVMLG